MTSDPAIIDRDHLAALIDADAHTAVFAAAADDLLG
jgi:hypothetical protein